MAPETFFVQLGYQFYGRPVRRLRPARRLVPAGHLRPAQRLTVLHVQDYNSGPIMGLDNQYHTMGGADFHIAMTDMMLAGFPVAGMGGVRFAALRQDQVAIGLPANVNAGDGYTSEAEVQTAFNYLNGRVPRTCAAS